MPPISFACLFIVFFFLYISRLFVFSFLFPSFSFDKMVFTHTGVDAFNKYLNTTVGREKLCRCVQYFARFYAYYLLRRGSPAETVQRWVDLRTHIANGRKFYRLLKPVEFAQAGIKSLNAPDEIVRFTGVAKQLGMCLYYLSEVFVLVSIFCPLKRGKVN